MAKGENIFKRKDGRWEARYAKGHDLTGKIKYGFCYGKTYKEAKDKAAKAKADILSGKMPSSRQNGKLFSFFCDQWLAFSKGKVKESTYVKYETVLTKHIKAKLGDCAPKAVCTELITEFAEELLTKDNLAPKTVKDILVVLRSILNYANKKSPGAFPKTEIVYPKAAAAEMRVLTKDEQTRFIAYLLADMDECKFAVLLSLLTGLRIGEVCALKWGCISLGEQTLTVLETMQRIKSGEDSPNKTKILIGTPKSDKSRRVIPLNDEITALCKIMARENPTDFILTGSEKYMEPRTLQYKLKKMTEICGLKGVHFHTLRHTFATRCVEAGFEIKSLSEVLGHANTTITLERYIHPSLKLKRDNMNKLSMIKA